MKNKDMWIALIASLGVGAATYYSISKSNNPVNKAVQSVAPMLTGLTMNNKSKDQTEQLGPFGMS